MGGLRRLSMRIGGERATRLFLSGDVMDGRNALHVGLLNRILSDVLEVETLAKEMNEFGPSAIQALREMRLSRMGPQDCEAEVALFAQPFATGECQRRLKALLSD
jgi:enoyl-CoA hydratase/carnithine racemase